MNVLYLIDATALLYRAYYAFIRNPLINSKGMNTSAIFGVINSFIAFIQKFDPEHIIVSFDRKAPTFRHEKSDLYKANRPPMPDELIQQIEPVLEFFKRLGLADVSMDGYEADDVLGTLAVKLKDEYDIVLVTGDKDYSQLVQKGIKIYDPMKDRIIDIDQVIEKYGVTPEQFVDYLALIGDSSDNIPGVKGIGPKGAEALLKQYQSLDEIYRHVDELQEKIKVKLETDKENAYLSQELARICLNVPIEIPTLQDFHFQQEKLSNVLSLLDEYEIHTLKRRIETMLNSRQPQISSSMTTTSININNEYQDDLFEKEGLLLKEKKEEPSLTTKPEIEREFKAILVDTNEAFLALLSSMQESPVISLDTETTSKDAFQAQLVGISLCWEQDKAYYLPLGHALNANLDIELVISKLKTSFIGKKIIGHNLKYDINVLSRYNWLLENEIFDTMLAAYILDPGTMQYSLNDCALRELNYVMQPIEDLIGKGNKQITFDLVDVNQACFYSSEDAWVAYRLFSILTRKLEFSGLSGLYQQIELPLVKVLAKMEANGVLIDCHILNQISESINEQLKILTDRIYAVAGYQFNINSTQQLAKLLFENLKLPYRKKTKTGYSTDNSVLEELADDYEIADLIMQYRQLSKLDNTYVSALPKLINESTGRLHSSFNQTIASTGRLSSSNPNLQNIPVRAELGRTIRKAFIAGSEDSLIVSADYSQIELRLLALMSNDETLLSAFQQHHDIHRQTAALIHNISLEQVNAEQRRQAKIINFGILYGMGQVKLSRELGISQAQAKEIINHYFERFPTIKNFIQDSINQARQKRYCETLFGRRLYLQFIGSSNQRLRSEAERVAVNMPIQGTAADLIKLAMIDIHSQIKNDRMIKMILQVHDELVFEIIRAEENRAVKLIRTAMENALPHQYRNQITLETEINSGRNWYEAH